MKHTAVLKASSEQSDGLQTAMWHLLPIPEAVWQLQTDGERGLIQAEGTRRLAQYGPNSLSQAHARSALAIFLAQFRSLIVALLVTATGAQSEMGKIGILIDEATSRATPLEQKLARPRSAAVELVKVIQRFTARSIRTSART